MSEQYVIDDPKFGKVYVSKTDKSLMMTNQVPDKKGGWVATENPNGTTTYSYKEN